jgi:hypothetical protein
MTISSPETTEDRSTPRVNAYVVCSGNDDAMSLIGTGLRLSEPYHDGNVEMHDAVLLAIFATGFTTGPA